jgi:hypothetical protein
MAPGGPSGPAPLTPEAPSVGAGVVSPAPVPATAAGPGETLPSIEPAEDVDALIARLNRMAEELFKRKPPTTGEETADQTRDSG